MGTILGTITPTVHGTPVRCVVSKGLIHHAQYLSSWRGCTWMKEVSFIIRSVNFFYWCQHIINLSVYETQRTKRQCSKNLFPSKMVCVGEVAFSSADYEVNDLRCEMTVYIFSPFYLIFTWKGRSATTDCVWVAVALPSMVYRERVTHVFVRERELDLILK